MLVCIGWDIYGSKYNNSKLTWKVNRSVFQSNIPDEGNNNFLWSSC